jgi:predicted Fe-Mo cluster-binding NifX family protein
MKVVVTAVGGDVKSLLDPRFGRAKFFVVADTDTGSVEAFDNAQNLNAAQGAGIQAAQTVSRLGGEALISGHVGPKAFQALSAAGIRMYLSDACTVEEAIRRFKAGELKALQSADVEGHWV